MSVFFKFTSKLYFLSLYVLFHFNGVGNANNSFFMMVKRPGFYRIRNPETITDFRPRGLYNYSWVMLLNDVFPKWQMWESSVDPIYKMFAVENNNNFYFLQLYGNHTLLIIKDTPPTNNITKSDKRLFKVGILVQSYVNAFQHVNSGFYISLVRWRITSISRDPSMAANLELERSFFQGVLQQFALLFVYKNVIKQESVEPISRSFSKCVCDFVVYNVLNTLTCQENSNKLLFKMILVQL